MKIQRWFQKILLKKKLKIEKKSTENVNKTKNNPLAIKFLKIKTLLDNSWMTIMEEKSKELLQTANLHKNIHNKALRTSLPKSNNKPKQETGEKLLSQIHLGNFSNCESKRNNFSQSNIGSKLTYDADLLKNSPIKENIYRDQGKHYRQLSTDRTTKKLRRSRLERNNNKLNFSDCKKVIRWRIIRNPNMAVTIRKRMVRGHLNDLYKKILYKIRQQEKYKKFLCKSSKLKA